MARARVWVASVVSVVALATVVPVGGWPEVAADPSVQDLAAECRGRGGPERACKSVQSLGEAAGHACLFAGGPDPACAAFNGMVISGALVDAYEEGDLHRRLGLQRRLEEGVPFVRTLLPSTHNSYNSRAYRPTLSGLDANQRYSLTDQLRMDMRGLELDVHWFPSAEGGGLAPIMCHGTDEHLGCTAERPLAQGLAEVRAWLDAHPGEFVLLYLENKLGGDPAAHAATALVIEQELGSLVLRPASGQPCAGMPFTLSRRDILDEGHRVLIVGNCGPGAWGTWVHERDRPTWDENKSGAGADYACDADRLRVDYETHWIRFWDDSTWLGAMGGAAGEIMPEETAAMVACGVNMPSFDQLHPGDPRLEALVWSWAPGEPPVAEPACAVLLGGRFHATSACADLATAHPAACVAGGTWTVTLAVLRSGAPAACAAAGATFAVPRTGHENELLRAAAEAAGATTVWLHYADLDGNGAWTAGT